MNIYPTPADLDLWIASSHKGDRFQYHLGNLMHDRAFRVNMATSGQQALIKVKPLDDIAEAAVEAYKQGYVVLAQVRVGPDMFSYVAVRTKKYRRPPMAKRKELVHA